MSPYRIHPIPVGVRILDKCMMTYNFGCEKKIYLPVFSWYLEGGEHTILVDTGMSEILDTADVRRELGPLTDLATGLARYGLTPEAVDIVIHTHLHSDHCENDPLCSRARIYVQRKEYETMRDPHPIDFRYFEEPLEEAVREGRLALLDGDAEVAPGIRVLDTPGHTPGGQTVLVDTAQGRAAITGFCCIMENFAPPPAMRQFMPVIPPGVHTDIMAAYESVLRVQREADIVIPDHEPSFLRSGPIG